MGDWNLPALTASYSDFLTYLGARDFDAISLGVNSITNPQAGMMRYVRASNRFQEFDGTSWQDKVISVAGGGTGANNASGARTSLGLGSIATQDANNVAISGGAIVGLGSLGVNGNVGVVGSLDVDGVITVGSAGIQPFNAAGKFQGLTSAYMASLDGSQLTGFTAAQIPNLDAGKITTGVIAPARLGSGTPSANTVLLGDGTWGVYGMFKSIQRVSVNTTFDSNVSSSVDIGLGTALTDYTKAWVSHAGEITAGVRFHIVSNGALRMSWRTLSAGVQPVTAEIYVIEGKNVG